MAGERFSIKNILLVLLIIILAYLMYKIVDIMLILFASYVLTCSFNPIVDKLEQKMPRNVATGLVLTIAVIIMLLILTPALIIAIKEMYGFLKDLPDTLKQVTYFVETSKIGAISLKSFIDVDALINNISATSKNILGGFKDFTAALSQWITVIIAVALTTYYWVSEKVYVKKRFLMFFPNENKTKADKITHNLSTQIGGYMIAQLSVMFAAGLFTSIGLIIIGVKSWFVLGLMTAIFDIIPIIGPIIAGVIALLMNIQGGPITAVLIVVVFFAAQWLQNAWARPIVYSKFLDINPVIIVMALLIAAKFLGFWGVILAPAMAAVVCTLIDELYIKPINEKS